MLDALTEQKIPRLESGDRLSRPEFERRYQAMPQLKKAELIEGVVYVPAALRFQSHAQPHGNLMGWLWTYKIVTPQVELGDNPTVRLDLDNAPQPDAVLLIDPKAGGQAQISPDDYIEGAPELVVEVAASSSAIDLHDKKRAYLRNGVQEYLVWQIFERQISWFALKEGRYESLPVEGRIIKSQKFPGLWLAVDALIAGEMADVLAVLQQGLASAEYADFAEQLRA
ncbi:Uma2 family endonuclease [Romeria aff. gracilis LEGE 07310]|uniref:Uma2 family endonuclease n=1 Tax=Vasconcelosia minhoensis LEGE 07310 TaxID=915328 RepID=A0A8J7AKA1_9CYAN|nr:Uma2 family endonuclease [Romeria gracilis]MBE9076239.1 Uma2 family endonuclease [Romeria aff. gracilis LEGE 07310]